MIAHIAGAPVEEMLLPALSAGTSAVFVALRAVLLSRRRTGRQHGHARER